MITIVLIVGFPATSPLTMNGTWDVLIAFYCEMWEDEALREGFGGAIYHGKNPVYAVYVDGEC